MRRHDREVAGLENILAILDKCEVLRLGLCLKDKPYVVPMKFAFEVIDEKVQIYLHCASEGKRLDIISKNNNVCFEADCSYKAQKSEVACNWSVEFESIIGEGNIVVLTDEAQKVKALDAFMKRYGFEGKPHYNSQSLLGVAVLQISVSSMTGKRKLKSI